jgi:hypothetical protein
LISINISSCNSKETNKLNFDFEEVQSTEELLKMTTAEKDPMIKRLFEAPECLQGNEKAREILKNLNLAPSYISSTNMKFLLGRATLW